MAKRNLVHHGTVTPMISKNITFHETSKAVLHQTVSERKRQNSARTVKKFD
jgi:hypothetical protein